ncbi:MAG TPA: protein kinase, partial [Planctomycetota bacterium]|nr:protein kinase [Planctomycetota bacterium]
MATLEGYELIKEIGRGGTGIVHQARAADGRDVAIKVIQRFVPPAVVERFERERRLHARLSAEQGFVPLIATGHSRAGAYIVMPYFTGGTLRDRLDHAPLPLDEALELARRIAKTVGEAHAVGIVHRDLKPENVIFDERGQPFVADLGLAKHFRDDVPGASKSVSLSKTGELLGTAGYMPAEQLRDASRAGPAADVFAIGVVLYECLVGEQPFRAESLVELLEKLDAGRFTPLHQARPSTPAWVDALVSRALAADPGARPADGAALARELAATDTTSRKPRIGRAVAAASAAGLIVAAAIVARPRPGAVAPATPAIGEATPRRVPEVGPPRELIDRVSRGDEAALGAAASWLRDHAIAGCDSSLDAALAERVRSSRGSTLEACVRAGLRGGPRFASAALELAGERVQAAARAGDVFAARKSVADAGALRLRFARSPDGDALLDAFYRAALMSRPSDAVWLEVLVAFAELDVDLDHAHLDLLGDWRAASLGDSIEERVLGARLRLHHKSELSPAEADELGPLWLTVVADERLGPVTRAHASVTTAAHLMGEPKIDALRRAVALDPESPRRAADLAQGLSEEKRGREAAEAAQRALALLEARDPVPASWNEI